MNGVPNPDQVTDPRHSRPYLENDALPSQQKLRPLTLSFFEVVAHGRMYAYQLLDDIQHTHDILGLIKFQAAGRSDQ